VKNRFIYYLTAVGTPGSRAQQPALAYSPASVCLSQATRADAEQAIALQHVRVWDEYTPAIHERSVTVQSWWWWYNRWCFIWSQRSPDCMQPVASRSPFSKPPMWTRNPLCCVIGFEATINHEAALCAHTSANVRPQMLLLLRPPGGVTSIAISVSVCMSVCQLAYLRNNMSKLHEIDLWYLWLGPPLTTMQCVMYLPFCGWRHIFTSWS